MAALHEETNKDELTKLEQILEEERKLISSIESERDRLKQDLDVLTEEHSLKLANEADLKKSIKERLSQIADLEGQV